MHSKCRECGREADSKGQTHYHGCSYGCGCGCEPPKPEKPEKAVNGENPLELPRQVKVSDLHLGDRVNLGDRVRLGNLTPTWREGYDTATVYKIDKDKNAHVWRPYVHVNDVVYSGNQVIPYIGLEDFRLYSEQTVWLIENGPKLK